jgi:hypothetical protein
MKRRATRFSRRGQRYSQRVSKTLPSSRAPTVDGSEILPPRIQLPAAPRCPCPAPTCVRYRPQPGSSGRPRRFPSTGRRAVDRSDDGIHSRRRGGVRHEMCTQRGSEAGVLGQRRTGGTGTADRLSGGTRSREMIFCSRSSALAVIIRSGRVRRWRSTMTMAERVYGAPAAAQSSHYAHFLPFSAGRSGNHFRGHYRKMALTLGIVPAELPYHLNRLNSRNTLRTNMPWFAVDVDCLHAAGVAADHRRREIRRHSRV